MSISQIKANADVAVRPAMEPEPTITLTKRADVILKLGRDNDPKRDVHVSSVVLSLASPVFANMFGDKFSEGQALSVDTPREVPLPGDDPAAMLLICRIAHLRTAELPTQLDANTFADLAVACEKYDCIEAVQAWAKVWMVKLLRSTVPSDFEKALFATYVLDLPQEFTETTLKLVFNRASIVNISNAAHGHDFLPLTIFDKLLQDKRQWEMDAFEALHTVTAGFGGCGYSKGAMANVILSLRGVGVWPLGKSSLWTLQRLLKEAKEIPAPVSACSTCGTCQQIPNPITRYTAEIEKIAASVKGLCLDCVNRDVFGDERLCRVTHPSAKTAPTLK